MKRVLLFAAVALSALVAGAWVAVESGRHDPPSPAQASTAELVGQPRPPYTLGAIDGRQVSASEFDGNVVLVNFWATWCAPCRKEMPMLVEVQDRYADDGLSVVGIALDDVEQAREFAASLEVTYTLLVGGADVMAASAVYGNRTGVLPYSVLIDRDGIIRWTHVGELEQDELVRQVEALL